MGWIKLDDAFLDHEKFLAAGPLAGYLDIAAMAWSNRNLKDGFIPAVQVKRLVNFDGTAHEMWMGEVAGGGKDVDPHDLAEKLVETGLWEEAPGGYLIHDYLDHQRSAEQIKSLSATRSDIGRLGGVAKQTPSKPLSKNMANAEQTPSKPPSKTQAEGRTKNVRTKNKERKNKEDSFANAQESGVRASENLPERLKPYLDPVQAVLGRVASSKPGSPEPTSAAVAKTIADFPGKDFLPVALNFEHYWLHGTGGKRPLKDVVRAFRNWAEKEPDVAAKTPLNGTGPVDDTAERLAEALR